MADDARRNDGGRHERARDEAARIAFGRPGRRTRHEPFTPDRTANFWSDIHHHANNVTWPIFFTSAALVFLAFNLIFAWVYSLGAAPIANLEPNGFTGLFYFSIETLSTVGYGDMHPQTQYGHLVSTIETFTGMSLMSVMSGLVFTRFSAPRARIVFARHPVVSTQDGRPALMIRLANVRNNTIMGASAELWMVKGETSAEGITLRRFHGLPLEQAENPVFSFDWTVFHLLDETSPILALLRDERAVAETTFILVVTGTDETTAQHLLTRHVYLPGDLHWNHRYADIVSRRADGRLHLEIDRFHETTAEI